jgi:hypothetical protein
MFSIPHSFLRWVCAIGLMLSFSVQAELTAEGFGSTPAEARDNALQELSQVVSAAVQSDVQIRTELRDNQVDQQARNELKIQSASYFQGVQYQHERPYDRGYKVDAVLDERGIEQTMNQLLLDIKQDMALLSRKQRQDVLERALFLGALANYLPKNHALANSATTQAQLAREEAYRYLNMAQLTFYTQPPHTQIRIGNVQFKNGQAEWLKPGSYRFEAKADGYQTKLDQIGLSAGELRQVEIKLVPKTAGQIELSVQGEQADLVFSEAKQIVAGYGLRHQSNADIQLQLNVEQNQVTEISGIKFYRLRIVAEIQKNGQPILVRRASSNNVADSQVENRTKALTKALIEALLSSEEVKGLW